MLNPEYRELNPDFNIATQAVRIVELLRSLHELSEEEEWMDSQTAHWWKAYQDLRATTRLAALGILGSSALIYQGAGFVSKLLN